MRYLIGFVIGVACIAAVKRVRLAVFTDLPITPEGWMPKYREWKDGEIIVK